MASVMRSDQHHHQLSTLSPMYHQMATFGMGACEEMLTLSPSSTITITLIMTTIFTLSCYLTIMLFCLHYLYQVATFGVGACEEMHSFMMSGLQRLTTCSGIKWVFLFLNWGLQTLSAHTPFLVGWVGMGMVQNTHVLVLIIINMKKETNQRLMVEFHDSKSFMYLE